MAPKGSLLPSLSIGTPRRPKSRRAPDDVEDNSRTALFAEWLGGADVGAPLLEEVPRRGAASTGAQSAELEARDQANAPSRFEPALAGAWPRTELAPASELASNVMAETDFAIGWIDRVVEEPRSNPWSN